MMFLLLPAIIMIYSQHNSIFIIIFITCPNCKFKYFVSHFTHILYLFPLPSLDNGCGLFLIGIQLKQHITPQKLHIIGGFFLLYYY